MGDASAAASAATPSDASIDVVVNMDPVRLTQWFRRMQSSFDSGGGDTGSAAAWDAADDAGGMADGAEEAQLYDADQLRDARGSTLGSGASIYWVTVPATTMVRSRDSEVSVRIGTARRNAGAAAAAAASAAAADTIMNIKLESMSMDVRVRLSPLFRIGVVSYARRPLAECARYGLSVTSITDYEPMPLTTDLLAAIIARCEVHRRTAVAKLRGERFRFTPTEMPVRMHQNDAVQVLRDAGVAAPPGGSMNNYVLRHGDPGASDTLERIFAAMLRYWAQGKAGAVANEWRMRRDAEVVRYFGWHHLGALRRYYTPRAIERQLVYNTPYTLGTWLHTVLETPLDACFMRATVTTHAYPLIPAGDNGSIAEVPVWPELTMFAYMRVLRDTSRPIDTVDVAAIAVYQSQKHHVTRDSSLLVTTRDLRNRTDYVRFLMGRDRGMPLARMNDALFGDAVALLRGRGVVHLMYASEADAVARGALGPRDNEPGVDLLRENYLVSLSCHRAAAELLRRALERVAQNAARHAAAVTTAAAMGLAPRAGSAEACPVPEGACTEQIAAIEAYRRPELAVMVVDGSGGSGKSQLAGQLVHGAYAVRRVVVTLSNQAVSVCADRLANAPNEEGEIVPGNYTRAFTMHSTIYAHASTHCGQKPARFGALHYDRCLFDSPIEELHIDEMSVVDIELLAVLVHGMAHCGALRRIVMYGDHCQLESIRPGDVFGDLIELAGSPAMARTMSLHRFSHNHRIDPAEGVPGRESLAASTPRQVVDLGRFLQYARLGGGAEALEHAAEAPLRSGGPPDLEHAVTYVTYEGRQGDDKYNIAAMVRATVCALDRERRRGEPTAAFVQRHQVLTFRRDAVTAMNNALADYYDRLDGAYMGEPGDFSSLSAPGSGRTGLRALGEFVPQQFTPNAVWKGQRALFKCTSDVYGVENNKVYYVVDMYDETDGGGSGGKGGGGGASAKSKQKAVRNTKDRASFRDAIRHVVLAPFSNGRCETHKTFVVPLDAQMSSRFKPANCVTNHSYQGAQQELIIYAMLPFGKSAEWHHDGRKPFYTAAGRTSQRLIVVVPSRQMLESIIERVPTKRITGIAHYIRVLQRLSDAATA